MAQNETLSELLAAGKSPTKAAEQLGVGRSTVYRWMREDPSIRERAKEMRESAFEEAINSLAESAAEAVAILQELARSAETPMARVQAATRILEYAFRGRQEMDVSQEIELLKTELKAVKQGASRNGKH